MVVHLYHAFPRNNKGGNAAGVVLCDTFPPEATMQKIAKEVGFSETVFGRPRALATFELRFFTPEAEVPLCGHATIAFLNHLRHAEIIAEGPCILETKAGAFSAVVKEDAACVEVEPPVRGGKVPIEAVGGALDIKREETGSIPPTVMATGVKEIFVEVKDRSTLASLSPVKARVVSLCRSQGVEGVYVFARDTSSSAVATGRNFLPMIGIPEESATGTASVSLAGLLHDHGVKSGTYLFEQGDFMGEPSRIEVGLRRDEKGSIGSALLCGKAIGKSKKRFSL